MGAQPCSLPHLAGDGRKGLLAWPLIPTANLGEVGVWEGGGRDLLKPKGSLWSPLATAHTSVGPKLL
jgi:hypothetical protein